MKETVARFARDSFVFVPEEVQRQLLDDADHVRIRMLTDCFDFREWNCLISVRPTESRIDQSQNIKMIFCFANIRTALLFTHSDSNPSSNIVFVSAIESAPWQVKFDHQLAVLPAETRHTVAAIIAAIEKEMKREWKQTQVRSDGTIFRVGRRVCRKSAAT